MWTLFVSWLFVAAIYLKRECCRLAEWTGLGQAYTVVIAAAIACPMAAAFTLIFGYGHAGTVFLSMVLAFGLTASLLAYIVLLNAPGGIETYYTAKREELLRLRAEYARVVKAELEATRQRTLQEIAQNRAREDAQRRADEELARQQATQDVGVRLPAGNVHPAPVRDFGGTQMESTSDLSRQGRQVVVAIPTKSVGVSMILTFLFGPLGMLYSTVGGALVMMVISVAIGVCTLGMGLLLTWPICILWGAVATSSYNAKLTRGIRQY
jgi:hypothetical protein